jgi:hypothetical protein
MLKTLLAGFFAAILSAGALAQAPPDPPPPPDPTAETQPQKQPVPPPEPTPEEPKSQPPTPTPTPAETPAQTPTQTPAQPPTPGVLSEAASVTYERRDALPNVNIYLPEGQASVRLRKLIRNVLFESQIDYEFVNGDISTFLRYKYYARNYTYRIGVFDSIEFPDIGSDSKKEFERVRGGLLLVGIPKDYNKRWFALLQDDRLTFGDETRPDNRKNNIYLKLGYQYGTQFDERLNSIVGEQRGRITPVLTAFRDVGPQRTGLAAAVTQSGRLGTGDYTYTKFETEGLHRFDITSTMFVFSRLHVGAFLAKDTVPEEKQAPPRDRDGDGIVDPTPIWEKYDVPQYELFRLGGREALKSVKTNDSSIGTYESHLTNELFFPIFRNRNYRLGALYWNTLYGIGYLGTGTVGFETSDITNSKRLVVDAGVGTESAIAYRDYDIFLSVIVVHPVKAPDDIDGRTFLFSIRTSR